MALTANNSFVMRCSAK